MQHDAFLAGDVVITDLASAADITRQKVDPSGARAVRYTPSGMVVSLGQSKAGQVLLWDPRTAGSGSGSGDLNLLNFRRPLVDSAQGRGVSDKDSYLTCLETHPSNEYEFYCGTSTGSIVVWDVRKNDISESGTVVELERCQGSSGQEGRLTKVDKSVGFYSLLCSNFDLVTFIHPAQ